MTPETVICEQLNKSFNGQPVVQEVSFRLPPSQILALLGPSGCGKTTILRLIAGFEALDSGVIYIAGQMVANSDRGKGRLNLPPEKRRVGMVFQDYAIFPHLSVTDNVRFGLGRGAPAQARVAEMLALVGLPGLGDRMPHELSGGQQQRVALARALAPNPAVLLLDEPFSNLDAALRAAVREEVRGLLLQSETTAIFVTHDQEEALFMGDLVGVMHAGRLEQLGTPEAIFHQPQTRFVAEFMGQTDFVPGEITVNGVQTGLGLGRWPTNQRLLGLAVEVGVRPDDVALSLPDEPGQANGRILSRQFSGMAYTYRLELADGMIVHSWQPHTVRWAVGTAVVATLCHGHSLPCFSGGKAVLVMRYEV